MGRLALCLAVVLAGATAAPALATRPPTPSERSAIYRLVVHRYRNVGFTVGPSHYYVSINRLRLRVSSLEPRWVFGVLDFTFQDVRHRHALTLFHRVGGTWRVVEFGPFDTDCWTSVPPRLRTEFGVTDAC